MTSAMPDRASLESAVTLACRAPSLHNSQPWRWVVDRFGLSLFSDPDRLLPATDDFGRQMVISCGAALNHLEDAFAAQGWGIEIDRMPAGADRELLATVGMFHQREIVPDDARLVEAILTRTTDRLPFAAPPSWDETTPYLQAVSERRGVRLVVLGERSRAALEDASLRLSGLRGGNPVYQAELRWWAGHPDPFPQGVPEAALPSATQRRSVSLARDFPSGTAASVDPAARQDQAAILLLATDADSRLDWLRCGEALSAVLLTCASRGLATCPVTHLTEMPATRTLVRDLSADPGLPQVLIRVGVATHEQTLPTTPRRPLSEVLFKVRPTPPE